MKSSFKGKTIQTKVVHGGTTTSVAVSKNYPGKMKRR